jgi:hypothetical protein
VWIKNGVAKEKKRATVMGTHLLFLTLSCKLLILATKNDPKIRIGGATIIIIIIIILLKTNTGGEARRKGLVRILQFL